MFVHENHLRCFSLKKTIFELGIELEGLEKGSKDYIRLSRQRENLVNRLNKLKKKKGLFGG